MKTNKLKNIFQSEFSESNSIDDSWRTIERAAIDLDFISEALEVVSDKDVANLEKRFTQEALSAKDSFLNYYLTVSMIVGLGVLSLAFMSYKVQQEELLLSAENKSIEFASVSFHSNDKELKQANYELAPQYSRISEVGNASEGGNVVVKIKSQEFQELEIREILEVDEIEVKDNLKTAKRHFDFRYLRNFKVLNFYPKKVEDKFALLGGVPAYKGAVDFDRDQEHRIELHYYRKLERALYLMEKGKYERSLTLFASLLYLFPKDQNTLFYAGLVHFRNEDYGYALHSWGKLREFEDGFFEEEAAWYNALALCSLSQFDKAKRVLVSVVKEDGFYKQQAAIKLSEIE